MAWKIQVQPDEDTTGRETSHTVTWAHEFQQDSPGSFPKLSLMESLECSRHSKSLSSVEAGP